MYNGKVVKALLKAKGFKGAQLSEHLYGNPRRSLTPIINAGANPCVNIVEKMAEFFEVTIDAFFTSSDDVPDVQTLLKKHVAPSQKKVEQYNNVDELIKLKDEQIHLLEERVKALECLSDTYRKEKTLGANRLKDKKG